MSAADVPRDSVDVPPVTISLVTWNGMRWLPGCLASVVKQTVGDWELQVIDNGSTDGSAAWLRRRVADDERMRLLDLPFNTGYAAAHNRTIRASRAAAILLLNQDVELDERFLAAALSALAADPRVGSVQGCVRRLGDAGARLPVIDTTGLLMQRDRRAISRDQLRDAGTLARPSGWVWGADGPAPLYRRAALLAARLPRRGGGWEVLDEDFFAYKEDVDLSWRLRRLGWSCRFEPAAVAWHARGGADSAADGLRDDLRANLANPEAVRILSWRNQRLMQLKNDRLRDVVRDLPWIARRELGQVVFMLVADRPRLRAIPQLLRLAPLAIRKRRALARRSRAT